MRTWIKGELDEPTIKLFDIKHYYKDENNNLLYYSALHSIWVVIINLSFKTLEVKNIDDVQGAMNEANEILNKL